MIAIVDYGMGNVGSVLNALKFLGAEAKLTADPTELAHATHIILPGVGAYGDGMRELHQRGLIPLLVKEVLEKKKPFLGICLGMQLLSSGGEEGGINSGLGFIPGKTRLLSSPGLRLPHIGWDDVVPTADAKLFFGVISHDFYFVHSYYVAPEDKALTLGETTYGEEKFTAILGTDTVFGTQFHPEKSQKAGLAILKNFIAL